MNLLQHPELLDRLASHYALGTLRGGARRRFETWAREHATVRAAALVWQTRWAGLNELQAQASPSPATWTRIDNLVRGDMQARAMQAARNGAPPRTAQASGFVGWLQSVALWRGAAGVGAAAAVVALLVGGHVREQLGAEIQQLQARIQAAPQIEYVAVLADQQAAASILVTFDPQNRKLSLQRIGAYQEAADRSLQLWALPPGGAPKSLGVLGRDKLVRVAASESDVRDVPTLAISLEPAGGVPSEAGPSGPVLFKGALIKKML